MVTRPAGSRQRARSAAGGGAVGRQLDDPHPVLAGQLAQLGGECVRGVDDRDGPRLAREKVALAPEHDEVRGDPDRDPPAEDQGAERSTES